MTRMERLQMATPAREPTLFEKIISGEIPADIVYEDGLVIAFRDIAPKAPQHVLVIPRKPIPTLADATDEDEAALGRLFTVARRVAEQLGIAEGGYRCIMNVRDDGGQEVPHVHLHVLGGHKLGAMIGP